MTIPHHVRDILAQAIRLTLMTLDEAQALQQAMTQRGITIPDAYAIPTQAQAIRPLDADLVLRGIERAGGLTLSRVTRERRVDAAQDRYNARTEQLAARLERTRNVQQWHAAQQEELLLHLIECAVLGKGGPLDRDTLQDIQTAAHEQQLYLYRFAVDVAQALVRDAVNEDV